MLHSYLHSLEQTDLKNVLKKIACDEAVFAPQLACSYLATSAYIESPGDWKAVRSNVKEKVREGRILRDNITTPHWFRGEHVPHRALNCALDRVTTNPNARYKP